MAGLERATSNRSFERIRLMSPGDRVPDDTLRAVVEMLTQLERQVSEARWLVGHLALAEPAYAGEPPALDPAAPTRPGRPRRSDGPTESGEAVGLRLFCLGPFEVHLGSEPIPQRRNGKGRAILKFLAAHPSQPVARDVLLEALWPEEDPEVANNRLRVAMHHLRRVYAGSDGDGDQGDVVIFREGCYMFNPAMPVWTDVEAFDAAWKAGARIERAGDLLRAVPFYESAERLYRGDYFEEESFEDWMLVRREGLKETYLRILDKLSHFWLERGEIDSAIDGWKKILVKDPWREDVYRNLMVSFARAGQRAVALRWFDLCAQVLDKELHLGPESETLDLRERIRRGASVQG
jgi:DNA-binding SARP family transcriptional activator